MVQRLLVADDHPMCATALRLAAQTIDPAMIVECVATLAEAESALTRERFDLVVLDLMLPDCEGFGGLATVRALRPATPVAMISAREELDVIRRALAMGARGYIAKSLPIDRMIAALRVMLQGGQWFPDEVMTGASDPADELQARIAELSVAQLRVLRAVANGQQNKQIAYDLNLAEPTVKSHLAAIFRKLGVSNRTQAVLALRALGDDQALVA